MSLEGLKSPSAGVKRGCRSSGLQCPGLEACRTTYGPAGDGEGWAQEGSGLGKGCGVNSALTIFESCLFLETPLTGSLPAPQETL